MWRTVGFFCMLKQQSSLLLLLSMNIIVIGIVIIAVAFDLVTGVDFVVTVVYFLAVDPNTFFFS